MKNIKDNIIELLEEIVGEGACEGDDGNSLSEKGLNSIAFIKLVVMLEEEYGFEVWDSDLQTSNFNTINKITAMVEKYIGEKQ